MSRSIITQSARAATRNNVIRTTALARPFSSTNILASDPNFQYPTSFASGSSKPSQSPSGPVMPWSEYLSYRKSKRIWTTAASVPSTLTGLGLGAAYFASIEADPTQLIFGLEPMLVYGGATFACMALGYLLGPTLGSSLFALAHPKLHKGNPSPIELMDREFFRRIAKNRGDPRFQSVQNPAPDFYGEKIVSIPTYRRWLRDQAVYKRKAQHGVPAEEL